MGFLSGCGGDLNENPYAADSVPDASAPDGPVAPEAETVESEVPVPSGPPSRYEEVTVTGMIDTLIPAPDACYAVTLVSGTFETPPAARLVRVSPDGSQTVVAGTLPTDRNYGPGTVLADGAVALAYQSTSGFQGQNGLAHGVFVFDENGNRLADHDLRALGITRPSAVLENETELLVLANNGSSDERVTFGDSSLVIIDHPESTSSAMTPMTLGGYKNAGAMALASGKLLIAAADSLETAGNAARFLSVDPQTGAILSVNDDLGLPQGVGVNGNAPLGAEGFLFTGVAMNGSGEAMAIVSPDARSVRPIALPSEIAATQVGTGYFAGERMPTFVQGGVFTPGGVMFGINRSVTGSAGIPELRAETYYYDLNAKETVSLDSTPADFEVAPMEYAPGAYCEAASGTGLDDEGNFTSTIIFRKE